MLEDLARLLSSRPESRGLHLVGALTRPREERRQSRCRKIRPDCSAVGPNLGGYTQWVRWRAPTETREEFRPAASSRQKKKKGAARRLAAWPVEPDRPGPPSSTEGSNATHNGSAGALREHRATPTVFGKLRLGNTKTNVSSSPAYFLHHAIADNPERCLRAVSAFYYSCITVRPGGSQSWLGGWPLGLRR